MSVQIRALLKYSLDDEKVSEEPEIFAGTVLESRKAIVT